MLFTSKPLSPQGRHVLITGASSGLGRETALHLAEQGFQVIAGVRRQEDGERLANACPSGRISTLLIDVTDEESIGRAAAQVAEKVGDTGLWGLVNNAGICISAPLECVSSDLLRRQLEVNLIGQLAVTRAILPLLRRGGAARLVNVTSGLGSVAIPYLGAYSAAQFAKEGVSDALRRELAPMGIQVSVVSPGAIWTPIWARSPARASAPWPTPRRRRRPLSRYLPALPPGQRGRRAQQRDQARRCRRRGACRAHRGQAADPLPGGRRRAPRYPAGAAAAR